MVRIASTGEIDPSGDSARPELLAVLPFLEKVTLTPSQASLDSTLPRAAIVDALHVNLIWNVVNRLANAFDFRLRDGQLLKGTRSLHRFGYRFPDFLVSGGAARSGDPVTDLRHSVFDSPGATSPETRRAAGSGDPLPEPFGSYVAIVRDHSDRITDADVARLVDAGHTEDEIFELTVAAATGAALRSLDAGLGALTR
jgi:alkylhydroperoxidase family enzyme